MVSDHRWQIVAIEKQYQKEGFDCGNIKLNEYIKKYARQNHEKGIAKTFIAVAEESKKIVGYYTLSSSIIEYELLPDSYRAKLPSYPIPAVLIGKLAVDNSYQRQGLGTYLLVDAVIRSLKISQELGVYAVRVDAIDDKAKAFYLEHEFIPFLDIEHSLFLPIATISKMFKVVDE
jgi:GNAT superfamily N-acetyltransferase